LVPVVDDELTPPVCDAMIPAVAAPPKRRRRSALEFIALVETKGSSVFPC